MSKKTLIFLFLGLLGFSAAGFAGVTNEGNEAVQIEINRRSGFSQRINLYPGQSETIPDDATTLKIIPRGFGARGDENIMIKVMEASGLQATLSEYGQIHVLNKTEEEEELITLQPGKMINVGNIVIDIAMTNRKGFIQKRTLYVDQSATIPVDIYEVKILSNRRLRGDERINLSVVMPDSNSYNITTLGGIARIQEET